MKICLECSRKYGDEHDFCPEDGTPLEDAPISKKSLGGEGLVAVDIGEDFGQWRGSGR